MHWTKLSAPWSFRQGLLVLLAFLFSYTALSGAHMYGVKYGIGFDAYLGHGPRLPPKLLLVNQIIKAAALLCPLWLFALRRHGLGWASLGFRPCSSKWLLAAVAIALAGAGLNLFLAKTMAAAFSGWLPFIQPRYAWQDANAGLMALLLCATIFITPLAEEAFFRGFLLQWMATRRPLWLAVLLSSLMFGASHIVPPQIILAALMSLFISLLFIVSRSIWPSIICHMANNALGVALSLAAAQQTLPAWLTPPAA